MEFSKLENSTNYSDKTYDRLMDYGAKAHYSVNIAKMGLAKITSMELKVFGDIVKVECLNLWVSKRKFYFSFKRSANFGIIPR